MNEQKIDFTRIIPEMKKERKAKQKEERTQKANREKNAFKVKTLLLVLLIASIAVGVYWFRANYTLQVPFKYSFSWMPLWVRNVTYAPIAYTDDSLLRNEQDKSFTEAINQSKNPTIAALILGVFGFNDTGKEMIAIFTAESGLDPKAKGWNCEYVEDGRTVSKACKPEDREKAWSVDCGVAQLNFAGTECPKESFDPVWNVQMAKLKYERQGKQAWVASWDDNYKKYLVKADK